MVTSSRVSLAAESVTPWNVSSVKKTSLSVGVTYATWWSSSEWTSSADEWVCCWQGTMSLRSSAVRSTLTICSYWYSVVSMTLMLPPSGQSMAAPIEPPESRSKPPRIDVRPLVFSSCGRRFRISGHDSECLRQRALTTFDRCHDNDVTEPLSRPESTLSWWCIEEPACVVPGDSAAPSGLPWSSFPTDFGTLLPMGTALVVASVSSLSELFIWR